MNSRALRIVPAALLIILAGMRHPTAQAVQPETCTALAGLQLPSTTIAAAETVTTGSFMPPGGTNPITNLPPFCRVSGTIAPTGQSQILFEVWMPLQKWNGKVAGVGNGGWAGTISWAQLAEQLRRGYADRKSTRLNSSH